jgi:carboxyl-terminal processing protease
VIRAGVFLLLLLVPSAFADVPPAPAAGFATALAGDVFAAALAFMAPRTLEPIGIPQMTLWGLRGLTALDPALTPELHADVLRLSTPGGALFQATAPAADDAGGWGHSAAAMAEAAWGASRLVQRAGTQGVISNFFDELFNHLDPYSRYEPPAEAASARQRRDSQAGIGLALVQRGAALIVASLLPDGPAARAGIRRGDRLLAIEGDAPPADATAAAARIAGRAQSWVALRLRDGRGRVQNLLVQRADLPPQTVFSSVMADLLVGG